MQNSEEHAAKKKYYRDRARLMDLFHLGRSRWTIRSSGDCVYAESDLGNTVWSKDINELQDVLEKAGVDQRDIKIEWR